MSALVDNRVFHVAAALFAVLSIASAIWPSDSAVPFMTWLAGIGIASLLLCLPYLILWFVGRRLSRPLFRGIALAAMALLFVFWAWAFLGTFIFPAGENAQAGLVFVAAPAYMIIAALFAGLVLRIADDWKKHSGSSS